MLPEVSIEDMHEVLEKWDQRKWHGEYLYEFPLNNNIVLVVESTVRVETGYSNRKKPLLLYAWSNRTHQKVRKSIFIYPQSNWKDYLRFRGKKLYEQMRRYK